MDDNPGVLPLPSFVARLREACTPEPDPERVGGLLAGWRPSLELLRPWISFDPRRYTRQRLFRDPALELLLLCWSRGQATPVHDHDGQTGWFTVLKGTLRVQEYERVGGPADLASVKSVEATAPGSVPLVAGRRLSVPAGSSLVEAAAPEAIHCVCASGGPALSLHLYAGPLHSFLVFDPERGTARRVRP